MPATDRTCNLCGEASFETIAKWDRRRRPLETVVCRTCGLVSHARIPSDDDLEQYYKRQYRQDYKGEYTPSAYRIGREWMRGRRLYGLLKEYVRPSDRVFEIGTGIGCNIKHFELAGHDASGVEPGEGFRLFSQTKLHCKVKEGVLVNLPQKPQYDLILLVHVLEHLNDPSDTFRRIRTMVTEGGQLYVEVPNLGGPHAAPAKLFHFAHIYNFTLATLCMLGRANGFDVVEVFSKPQDKNLAVLFAGCGTRELWVDPNSVAGTFDALTRYNALTYHLRWWYLKWRIEGIGRQFWDRVLARRRLRRIFQQCKPRKKEAACADDPSLGHASQGWN